MSANAYPASRDSAWDGVVLPYVPAPFDDRDVAGLPLSREYDTGIDPVSYQVLRWRLWNINLEHDDTIRRVCGTSIVCHALDYNTSMLAEDGRTILGGQFAREIREPNVLTTDMGGTTYDVSLIQHDTASLSDTARVEKFELSLPILDVESIGAGGGSIAWTDESSRLNVGPRSAGAEPGPACYGRGGREPTVTDADVVLGFIDPDTFLHGEVRLDIKASERALATLGAKVGLDIQQTAAGICRIVDAKMAGLLRRSSEFRGVDPRQLTMLAFGGAGPVHAAMCARQAGIPRVVVPPPAVASGTTKKRPLTGSADAAGAAFGESSRRVYWPDLGDWVQTPVLRTSGRWEAEREVNGPALIEVPNTVIVVPEGMTATMRRDGAVAIE